MKMLGNLNTTVNGTQLAPSGCFTLGNSTAERIAQAFGYCLIFVVSLAGNISIGLIVYKTKTMRKAINFFIVNMAMSDLVFPLFAIPWFITLLNFNSWPIRGPLGEVMCKLTYFLPNVSVAVSIQSLVLIAVDRFGAVVLPLRSPIISSKLCPYFMFTTWIAAIILLSPNFIAFKLTEYPGKLICELHWTEAFGENANNVNYLIALLLLSYCIPFGLITTLYSVILLKLKAQKIIGEPSTNAEQNRVKRHKHVLKMATAIIFSFAICWTPLTTCYFYYLHSVSQDRNITSLSCSAISIFHIVSFIAHTNCAINPVICFSFSGNYRQGLRRLLKFI